MGGPDFQTLFDHLPNSYMVVDRELRYVAANRSYQAVSGKRLDELVGRYVFDVFPNNPHDPEDSARQQLKDSFSRVLQRRVTDEVAHIRYRVFRQTEAGPVVTEERIWSATHVPVLDAQGEVAFIIQHTADVTDLQSFRGAAEAQQSEPRVSVEAGVLGRAQRVQEANLSLDAERRHLRSLFQQAPGFVCALAGPEFVFELANDAYKKLVGGREVIGKPLHEALPEIAGQGFLELLDRVYATGEAFVGRGVRMMLTRSVGGEPEEAFLDFVYQPILNAAGRVVGIFVQGQDITEQRRAEEQLRRYREDLEALVRERTRALEQSELERRRAQDELFQSQKMEALGKLTGGVAHDFNNLLQVISGNLQLLEGEVRGDRAHRRLAASIRAVERGARLSSQLLAYARKQPLQPRVVGVGSLLARVDELLQRTIGEDIELLIEVEPDAGNALADPHQLENVLLNLAINSRDAMAGAGRLTLAARNVTAAASPELAAGDYVELSVTDTGCGMTPEVKARAFEPFFTTKPAGEGSGLGLSMVYGFVKQSGGHVELESEPGQGTRIRLLLPRTLQAEALVSQPEDEVRGGHETVLVVEDDAAVRATVVELLQTLGYHVRTAEHAAAALALLEGGLRPELIFSDVVMPGAISSTELATRARKLHPGVQVLFTSGYTADRLAQGGKLPADVALLGKPYTREVLAAKLRQLLGGTGPVVAQPVHQESGPERVLLVEDDDDIRDATCDLLTDLGFQVTAVGTTAEAIDAVGRLPFDVLFTDIRLGGSESGVDLARKARQQAPGLRLLLASGLSRSAMADITSDLEGVVLLCKPYDVSELQQALAQ